MIFTEKELKEISDSVDKDLKSSTKIKTKLLECKACNDPKNNVNHSCALKELQNMFPKPNG